MTPSQTPTERVLFLDNIRYLMVLSVIVFHASIAYSTIVPWWFVVDSSQNQLMDLFILILDNFQLPVLFFISGYFVLPSLRKKSASTFITSKLRRLGIPLIVLGLFYSPVMPYIRHVLNTPEPMSYLSYWMFQIQSISDFSIARLYDYKTGIIYANHFSHWHLWFISLLLAFLLITAAVYYTLKKLFPAIVRPENGSVAQPQSNGKILMVIFGFGTLLAVISAVVNINFYSWEWMRIGSFLSFQPSRIPVYSGIFIMGMYAYHRQWFNTPLPGHYFLWFILAGILTSAMIVCLAMMGANKSMIQPVPSAAAGFIRVFLVISWIFAFMNFANTRWNSQGTVGRQFSLCSYELYLIHMPIVVLLQYAMMPVTASAFVKFGIVAVVSVGMTFAIARLFLTAFPKWSSARLFT